MSGGTDRWYVSGSLGVGTAYEEPTDAHSARSGSWGSVGTAIRHNGWETLNLLDGRSALPNQGPNLNWWALNAAGKAVRLGVLAARMESPADGASSAYLSVSTKPAGGDVAEALRITSAGDLGVGTSQPQARLDVAGSAAIRSHLTVGAGSNGTLKVRHVDGKHFQSDNNDGLFLNYSTAMPVYVGGPQAPAGLNVYGDAAIRQAPPNDSTPSLSRLSLVNRAAGGAEATWTLYTAAVGGGWGVTPNAFEIWEYPATASRLQIRQGGNTILSPSGGGVGVGTTNPREKLHVAGNALLNNVFLGDVGHGGWWAGFSHGDSVGPDRYALLQSADGLHTLINKRPGGGHIGFRVGNNDRVMIDDAGNVGVGTSPGAAGLHIGAGVSGGQAQIRVDNANGRQGIITRWTNRLEVLATDTVAFAVGSVANDRLRVDASTIWLATSPSIGSDARLKRDLRPLGDVLDRLDGVRGVSFHRVDGAQTADEPAPPRVIGVVAQEVEAAFPELVTAHGDPAYMAVDYGGLTGVLVEAVKQLRSENRALQRRLAALEAEDAPRQGQAPSSDVEA